MKIISKFQYNWPIIGHTKLVEFLKKSLSQEKYSHGYIFVGPEGVGKETVAKFFVHSIICQAANKDNLAMKEIPCYKCPVCQQINKKAYPDIFIIEKEQLKQNISIEQIRNLQHFLNLKSFISSIKIALILEAETLSEEASNSLLKTLEEPYGNTIIILISSRPDLLLPTIVSRCQIIRFGLVPEKLIYKHLIDMNVNRDLAKDITALTQGKVGKAINLVNSPEYLEYYENKIDQFIEIMKVDLAESFRIISLMIPPKIKLQEITEELKAILLIWKSVIRDQLLLKINLNQLIVNKIRLEKLKKISQKYTFSKLTKLISDFDKTQLLLEKNINPKLLFENLVINIKQNI